jgi:hypothetical protein
LRGNGASPSVSRRRRRYRAREHGCEHVFDDDMSARRPSRFRFRDAASKEQPHSEQRHAIMEAYPEANESCSLI